MLFTALFMIHLYLRGSPMDSTIFYEDGYGYTNATMGLEDE
jgi:hypothetical protein